MALVLMTFVILAFLAVPIGYVMGISSLVGLISMGGTEFLRILITRFHSGLNSFLLVAIPFFVLAAEFMNRSGITNLLIDFVNKIIGHLHGGLSHVNIGVSILFGTLTGSAVTDTIAIGGTLIPAMKKEGYSGAFSAAVTATSLPLFTPVIILAPILLGITTITEAASMGAFYALILGVFVYKTLKLKDIIESAFSAAKFGGIIFLLICAAHTLGWFITRSGISITIAELLTSTIQSPYVILFLLNIFLLIVGMFVDTIPAVIILAPILAPPLIEIGFHPVHIAMIILVNLNIGNATPPMGMTLMTASKIAQVPYESAIKEAFPFIVAEIIACFLITYLPVIPLWLPRLLGFI